MTDADAALLYSRVGRVYFDGMGDALNFVNTIESRTRTGYSDYQRIMVVEISVKQRLKTGSCSLYSLI